MAEFFSSLLMQPQPPPCMLLHVVDPTLFGPSFSIRHNLRGLIPPLQATQDRRTHCLSSRQHPAVLLRRVVIAEGVGTMLVQGRSLTQLLSLKSFLHRGARGFRP